MPDAKPAMAPTGPALPTEEVLQRVVGRASMAFDGLKPLRGAFIRASHDHMMSTAREAATLDEVFAVLAMETSVGVWPVPVSVAEAHDRPAYGDAGQPCGCVEPGCEQVYPVQHASVDLREASRKERERFAGACLDEAIKRGPIHRTS